ncbi:hypothetical protein X732_03225 [Mesorhizobium sp. L2C066B000]|nr:hypothetical protein X732_03225 [Mesorhizobium sp. L2C066B000]
MPPSRREIMILLGKMLMTSKHVRYANGLHLDRRGPLFIVGGNFRLRNRALWRKLVSLVERSRPEVAVIPIASANPLKSGEKIASHLAKFGLSAFVVPLSSTIGGGTEQSQGIYIADRIRNAGCVYFTGGRQARITGELLTTEGRPSPTLQAIYDCWSTGGVIAGSSAGAAIMGHYMFKLPAPPIEILLGGVRLGTDVDAGLGFLDPSWIVDQHFLQRGRLARLIATMAELDCQSGVGVDENTAVVVHKDEMTVSGETGAVILNLSTGFQDQSGPGFCYRGASLSFISEGDTYLMNRKTISPAPGKTLSGPDKEISKTIKHCGDIFAPGTVLNCLNAVTFEGNVESLATAQSKDSDQDQYGRQSFVFRFYRDPQKTLWYSDGDRHLFHDIRLDVYRGAL